MRTVLAFCVSLLCAAPAAQAGENILLVLDASGSMWGKIGARSKVEIARETVAGVLQDWNPDDRLGLIAYGHRRKGDCGDIETLIPVGPLDKATYLRTVNGLDARGMTPLTAAVREAAAALKSSEQKATVILVSDGEETCNLDPCVVGAELERAGVDFTAHVIGFDVADAAHQAQLRCLAETTGGRYFNARDARELSGALQGAVRASTEAPPPPTRATVAVEGPIAVTQSVTVRWTGPADDGDYLAFAEPAQRDGEYITYSAMLDKQSGGKASLPAPAKAGTYELRYVNPRRNDAVLARIPVTVGDAEASIEAPESVVTGTRVKIIARGPVSARHWVGFAPVGSPAGTYLAYARMTGPVSELELMPPAEPGNYELRFVLNESERVLASRPITVTAGSVSVKGAASVMAGDAYPFTATGPADGSHWIGFAPAGSDVGTYLDYVRPSGATSEGVLAAPSEPGAYELRYVLNESERVVASQLVTVLPATATLTPQGEARTNQTLRIGFAGPRGHGNWIGFVTPGTLDSQGYATLPVSGDAVVEIVAPGAAGPYELVFVVDGKAIARSPVAVH